MCFYMVTKNAAHSQVVLLLASLAQRKLDGFVFPSEQQKCEFILSYNGDLKADRKPGSTVDLHFSGRFRTLTADRIA